MSQESHSISSRRRYAIQLVTINHGIEVLMNCDREYVKPNSREMTRVCLLAIFIRTPAIMPLNHYTLILLHDYCISFNQSTCKGSALTL